jgi:hypothetical protein
MGRSDLGVALLLMFAAFVGAHACSADDKSSFERIINSWRTRSTNVRTLRAEIAVKDDFFRQFSRHHNEWVPHGVDGGLDLSMRLVIDGDRVRFDATAWLTDEHTVKTDPFELDDLAADCWIIAGQLSEGRYNRALYSSFLEGDLEYRDPQAFIGLSDGKRRLNFLRTNGSQFSRLTLFPASHTGTDEIYFHADNRGGFDLDNLIYQPLLLAFRPFDKAYAGIDQARCSLAGEAVVRGRRCRLIRESLKPPRNLPCRWFFIDPERDCSVMRYIGEAEDAPDIQIDIDYEKHNVCGWIPSSWQVMRIESPERPLQNFASFQVIKYQINEPVAGVSFEVTPPARTWILDWEDKTQWLERNDGSRRPILLLECKVAADYDTMVNSEPGDASLSQDVDPKAGGAGFFSASALWAPILGGALCLLSLWRARKSRPC